MQIPHDAMVVVADGRKMLLFRNEGDAQFPKLEVVEHEDKPVPAREDLATDEPGSKHDYGAGMNQRSGMEETDFHQLEEDRFAADTAEMLRKRALRNEFSQLIVVAPPRALGELRKHYHKEVEARIIGEIAKDFANRPTDEIEQLIANSETKGSA
jgi:protein required for attachment to host cells